METDPTRMCELLVGLPDVEVVGVGEWLSWLRIAVRTRYNGAGAESLSRWRRDTPALKNREPRRRVRHV